MVFVRSGVEVANAINSAGIGKITTLDIVSHGNQGGIQISRNLSPSIKSGFIQKRTHVQIRKLSDKPQSEEDAEYIE